MPSIAQGSASSSLQISSDANYNYKYPGELNLRPDSKEHADLVSKIYSRVQESSNEMSKRFPTWRKIDKSLTAFISLDDAETLVQENDDRKPVSIVVPYSYAILETLLTYMSAAFLDAPIFRYQGVSDEDIIGSIMLENVVNIQCTKAKAALALHTSFRDGFSYGLGVVAPTWETRWGKRSVIRPDGILSSIFQKFIKLGQKKVSEDAILYEGNVFNNIDPYLYLPDPSVPADNPQKGEYVGWIEPTNYMRLLNREKDSNGNVFNVQYLNVLNAGAGRSQFNKTISDSGRYEKTTVSYPTTSMTRPIDVAWMYITIIPKEWKLSTSTYPEKWLFGLASDKVVVAASPMGLDHNMYPVGVCVPDSDGYSISPVSRLEMVQGLQTTLDWLFSSHMTNVRKAINDMIIVDPSLVNINDLKDPAPGKLIRMRRTAWGRGVENAVKQLQVNDITRQHIADSGFVTDLMQKSTGSVDIIMGFQRRTSERVSATESSDTRNGALSRLSKTARLVSLQMMQDLGYMAASHTQQLMSREQYVAITDTLQQNLMRERGLSSNNRIKVDPFSLAIDYDCFIKDGSIQGTEDAQLWVQLFQIINAKPELAQQYDTGRIFLHIARQMGAKNVQDFLRKDIKAQILPDGKTATEVQAGNLVSMSDVLSSQEGVAQQQAATEEARANAVTAQQRTIGEQIKNFKLLTGGESGG